MTFKDAITKVLQGEAAMTLEQIADALNEKKLYCRRNGRAVDAHSAGLRVINLLDSLEVTVRLRHATKEFEGGTE